MKHSLCMQRTSQPWVTSLGRGGKHQNSTRETWSVREEANLALIRAHDENKVLAQVTDCSGTASLGYKVEDEVYTCLDQMFDQDEEACVLRPPRWEQEARKEELRGDEDTEEAGNKDHKEPGRQDKGSTQVRHSRSR